MRDSLSKPGRTKNDFGDKRSCEVKSRSCSKDAACASRALIGFAKGALLSATIDIALGYIAHSMASGAPEQLRPTEVHNRATHYGRTPTKADRTALGAGPDQVVDHDPPLANRFWEGDPAVAEKPGYQMTPAERKASGADRSRMRLQSKKESNAQGGKTSAYSKDQRKKWGLEKQKQAKVKANMTEKGDVSIEQRKSF